MISDSQLRDLAEMSERIGSDASLVQGPGGNTSIKDDRELWVKASGLWLAEAMTRPAFVPIRIEPVREAMTNGSYDVPAAAIMEERNSANLRPSIETALHALMPHKVVIHAHAVNAMTTSILANGEEIAAQKLSGLSWDWIAYHRPGAPLARAVARSIQSKRPDILILQNHGLVVGADTTEAAEALLHAVEERLAWPERPFPAGSSPAIATHADERFDVHSSVSELAMDASAYALLSQVVLVPDQVVFLGGAVPTIDADESVAEAARRVEATTGVEPKLFMLAGVGALVARERSDATDALIDGLAAIARRVPMGARTTGLSQADVAELLGWDAEHHRRMLDAQRTKAN